LEADFKELDMHDYRYDAETEGWNASRVSTLHDRLKRLLRTEFEGLQGEVRAVDYPTGSVRLINLASIDNDATRERLTARADAVYREVMSVRPNVTRRFRLISSSQQHG
jgi:hypothetical protein